MITCPNCGQSVRESQRFCGTCGTDVQAALSAASPGRAAADEPGMPYAYSQPSGYGYENQLPPEQPRGRMFVIAAALILAVCCAFACGLVFGFEIIPDLLGIGGAAPATTPRPGITPTPSSLLPILQYLIG